VFFEQYYPDDELCRIKIEFPINEAFQDIEAKFHLSTGGSVERQKQRKFHTIKKKMKKRKYTIRNGKPKRKKGKQGKTTKRRKMTRRKRKDHR
jgi:hypothetical protein